MVKSGHHITREPIMKTDYQTTHRILTAKIWSHQGGGHQDPAFRFALWQAIREKMSRLPKGEVAALPFSGYAFVSLAVGCYLPPTADSIHLLCRPGDLKTGQISDMELHLQARFFGAFRYALMDLTHPHIEPVEAEAETNPNLVLFLSMEKDAMVEFLSAYVAQLDFFEAGVDPLPQQDCQVPRTSRFDGSPAE
jgi:hypothetical protein